MLKRIPFLLLGLFAGFLICRLAQKPRDPWIPVLEGTSFSSLMDPMARAMEAAQQAADKLASNEIRDAGAELQKTMDSLSRLQFYFIPMAETRQLVYDADRLFYLGRVSEAKRTLEQAKSVLKGVGEAEGHRLRQAADKLILLLDDLLLTIDEAPGEAQPKFRLVGNRVNLMLLKGDLVLSGTGVSE